MTAINKNIFVEQGSTFTLAFNWYHESLTTPGTPGVAYDLTGCVAKMQIRKSQGSEILVNATSAGVSPMITFPAPLTSGRIVVKLTDIATDALVTDSALYDLEIQMPVSSGGDVHRLLNGKVTISPNITQ